MNKKYKKLALALGLMSFGVSNAALNIHSNAVELAKTKSNEGNYSFVQEGLSPESTSVVKGFGKDMPLNFSMKMIVPNDWKVEIAEGAEDLPVSWQGKVTWPYVLENMAKENDLDISINWDKRAIEVVSREIKQQQIAEEIKAKRIDTVAHLEHLKNKLGNKNATGTVSLEKIFNDSNVKPLDNKMDTFIAQIVDKKINAYTKLKFILKPERMLTENIKEWAYYVDWDLKWDAKTDYRITREVVLEGTFLEVVDEVLKLYKNAEKPLKANFYIKNTTLEIVTLDYENKNGDVK